MFSVGCWRASLNRTKPPQIQQETKRHILELEFGEILRNNKSVPSFAVPQVPSRQALCQRYGVLFLSKRKLHPTSWKRFERRASSSLAVKTAKFWMNLSKGPIKIQYILIERFKQFWLITFKTSQMSVGSGTPEHQWSPGNCQHAICYQNKPWFT